MPAASMWQMIVVSVCATAAFPLTGQAQEPVAIRRPIEQREERGGAPTPRDSLVTIPRSAPFLRRAIGRPALAPLFSAVIPGAGQLVFRQDRFVAYTAMELLFWLKLSKDVREQGRQEGEYRGLARQVARAHFSATQPDGDWDYYETMEKWFESGAYSLSSTELIPESDPTTFNGDRWAVAQRNHGVDPQTSTRESAEYQAALGEYSDRAAGPDFLWSWRNAQLEWDLYRRIINKRNDAAHAVGVDITLLLANHVLSTVDAFAEYRLRVLPSGNGGVRISGTLPIHR
jgi:hypothetical protein